MIPVQHVHKSVRNAVRPSHYIGIVMLPIGIDDIAMNIGLHFKSKTHIDFSNFELPVIKYAVWVHKIH
jgi:hypothetical protein